AAFLLVSTLTDSDAVRETARAAGLRTETVTSESYPFERLLVVRLSPAEP
ncbi:methyltransferase, partial [Halobacteriales archaeon QH_10_67_22]